MIEIKDHMNRGVQCSLEDGLFVINHPEGKLRLYAEDVATLVKGISDHQIRSKAARRPKAASTPPVKE